MNAQSKTKIITNLHKASDYLALSLMELNKEGHQEEDLTKQIKTLKENAEKQLNAAFRDPIIAE